jgi:magnesium transporter
MLKVIQPQFTRLHLVAPTSQEVAQIQKEYDFHELIIEDIIELNGENKVEYYEEDNAVSLLINFPKYDFQAEKYIHNPCVIIVSEKYVLSVSKYSSKHIDKFSLLAQQKTYLEGDFATPTFDLVYDIVDMLYEKSVKWLNKASQDVLGLQDSIETRHQVDKWLLEDLMTKKINMIVLQHIFRPQRQILHEFKSSLKKILHTDREDMEDVRLYIEDLDSKLDKILDSISLNYESLKSLTESYGSMIDLQTNKTITRLTVVTVATGFMAVIAGLFGMNVPIPW